MPRTLSDIVKLFTNDTKSQIIDDVIINKDFKHLSSADLKQLVSLSNTSEATLIKFLAHKNADETVIDAVIGRTDFVGARLSKGQSEKVITAITNNTKILNKLDAAQLIILAKHQNANKDALIKIIQASKDANVLNAVIERNKQPSEVIDNILQISTVQNLTLTPENLNKLVNNHSVSTANLITILKKASADLTVLKAIINKFDKQTSSDLINAALQHPLYTKLTPKELTTLAKHPNTPDIALQNIARNPKNLSVLQSIINRDNFLSLSKNIINEIISNDPFILTKQDLIKLANHPQTDDAMLLKIINKAQDVEVFQAIIAKQPQSTDIMKAITEKTIPDKKGALTALISDLNKTDLINLAKNPHIPDGAIASIITHSKADIKVWQQIITNHPDRLEDIMNLGDKTLSKGDRDKLLSVSLQLSKTKDDTPTAPSPTQTPDPLDYLFEDQPNPPVLPHTDTDSIIADDPHPLDEFLQADTESDQVSEIDAQYPPTSIKNPLDEAFPHQPKPIDNPLDAPSRRGKTHKQPESQIVLEESEALDKSEATSQGEPDSPLSEFEEEFSPQWATKIIDSQNNEFSPTGWAEYFASDEGKTLTVTKLENATEVPQPKVELDYKTTDENSGTVFKKNDPNTPIMHISGKTLSFVGNPDENVAMAVKSLNAISQANLASGKYRRISFPESAFTEKDILRILYQTNAQHLDPDSTDKCNVEILIKDDREFSPELREIIERHNENARAFQKGQPTPSQDDLRLPNFEDVLATISQAKAQEEIPITPRSQTSDDSPPATDKRRDSTTSSNPPAEKEPTTPSSGGERRASTGEIPTAPTLTVVPKEQQRRKSLP